MPRNKAPQSHRLEPTADGKSAEHLSVEVLSAYYRRTLAAPTANRVRRHVVMCPECRDLLLDLARFLEDRQGLHHHSAAEVMAAWKKLLASRQRRPLRPTKRAGA